MSGRWLTAILLTVCVALVSFALWRRSIDTQHVREFWGADQAALVQRAPTVLWRTSEEVVERATDSVAPGSDKLQRVAWKDISRAAGLIHLRATLVDDRYYRWPASTFESRSQSKPAARPQDSAEGDQGTKASNYECFRFIEGEQSVDVALHVPSGMVILPDRHRQAQIIESSRQALHAYVGILHAEFDAAAALGDKLDPQEQ